MQCADKDHHVFGVFSRGIKKIPFLSNMVCARLVNLNAFSKGAALTAVAGWGLRPTTLRARQYALKKNLPFVALEDGFLRSFATGATHPPLSVVVDEKGIYYDATHPSSLEALLNSKGDFDCDGGIIQHAREFIRQYQLSKYNHATPVDLAKYRLSSVGHKILLVDQTFGDMSVQYGAADASTFEYMLRAARLEHPNALIYVKTHPEVSAGSKRGYLTEVQDDERTVVIREAVNPLSLIERMDHVYVVTSTMGFEALLMGKPVTVFGMPWYAGWGVTNDHQVCARRTRQRTVDELFYAAYFCYARYLNPITRQQGDVFDAIQWLRKQKEMSERYAGRMICVGFRRWKAANIKPMLSLFSNKVAFVKNAQAAALLKPSGEDCLVHWGRDAPTGLADLCALNGVRLLRMEDGFVRSVGLGSDLIRPQSLVLDASGIYFDPTQESDLEKILNDTVFSLELTSRAKQVRAFIVEKGITKYNTELRGSPLWDARGAKVILVPGQVEDDASIRYGCEHVKTNLALLQAARDENPDAFIVYKPHPDVMASNRKGKVNIDAARQLADHIETEWSVVSCIEAADDVYTMTSLTGFDALLRGKRIVVFGRPFYAGWGLTEDKAQIPRRRRTLNVDELVAGALLEYPFYWDWDLKGYTSCEAVLQRIVEQRDGMMGEKLKVHKIGYFQRQVRKAKILSQAWINRGSN
ncbi:hypothetical protein DTO96_100804 [Ephemeroptericola cinctiostellae]|uniref:Capsule polysaccharide biosynthesis protein n=1 Tax=Ephemeroptericola cinctiostellae TaxID=2268024 RepID=A0A345D9P7_9BURK|nr:capsular polysaccharide biosynthesis protein [Ephemeroptericola cinctiostellae]AXF85085.1 hypothetical protein DTO96_100804 [Ephemeroptericola cinctiostellae]